MEPEPLVGGALAVVIPKRLSATVWPESPLRRQERTAPLRGDAEG